MRLQACVRAGDTVARISGDEFAVMLGDLATPDDAALVAQKIIDALAGAGRPSTARRSSSPRSVGIAVFPGDGDDAETLLGAADAAMYRAKQAGRNAFQFFTADINQRTRRARQLGRELRRALEREEFALAYQPKFDLADRPAVRRRGAAALERIPSAALVSPVRVHPGAGGDRPDRAGGRVGAARGLRATRGLAGGAGCRRCRSRSTSRRASSASRTSTRASASSCDGRASTRR